MTRGTSTRRTVAALIAATLVLLVAILILGVYSSRRLVEVVTEQFNTQQLMLARQVAQNIETRFLFLRQDLASIAEFADEEDEPTVAALLAHQARIGGFGLRELRLYDGSGRLLATTGGPRELSPELAPTLAATRATRQGDVVVSDSFLSPGGEWLQLMATPLRVKGHGSLVAVLDPLAIAGSAAGPVRSGQTGYAFVLSSGGRFLFHYEPQFIGQDAFKVRVGRNPLISFERINRIQKEYMLRGLEGTSWYYSGWHREQRGQIEKLIAYTPAHLGGDNAFWSVAVVAPVSEVDGLIGQLQLDQWLLTGLALLVVVGGFGAAVYFSVQWSSLLATEVDAKTAALRRSEGELRQERDKVKESYEQLIEAQSRLIRSERLAAIGEAAAKVCHEIKNPLMVIGGFAGQLLRHAPEEGNEHEKLAIILKEVERLEAMMIEVGDFTKPMRLNRRPVDLGEVAGEVRGLMGEELARRGIKLSLAAPAAPHQVVCDPEKIKQVLINLVKNAAEAMPEGGSLRLAVRAEPGWSCVDVTDTGRGIEPADLESIFTPFFTTKKGGSGLGLSVCHKIIQDHGGRIEVRSEPRQGSTFSVMLPPGEAKEEEEDSAQGAAL